VAGVVRLDDPDRLRALEATGLMDAPAEEAFARITRLAASLLGTPVSLVSLVDAHRQFFAGQTGLPEPWASRRGTPLSHSFCQHVVVSGEPLVVTDARLDPRVAGNGAIDDLGVTAYAGVPLCDAGGHRLGSFCVIDGRPRRWTDAELGVLRDLGESVMTEIALRHALQEAEHRSRTDALTGLWNRRHFLEELERERARAARGAHGVVLPGVIVADIDRFKAINDRHGHAAGDAVIAEVAARLRAAVRPYDAVARWGGEEFTVMASAVGSDAVLMGVAEHLRRAVADRPVDAGAAGPLDVTISLGAVADAGGGTAEGLVDLADRALYAAKRRGRNLALLASDMTPEDTDQEGHDALRTAHALARAAGLKEGVPDAHAGQVAEMAAAIGRHMGLDTRAVLRCRLAGLLHDVGKISVPGRVLNRPGALGPEEWELIRAHPELGADIVADLPGLEDVAPGVRHHHERVDGTGYPAGLRGEDIPLEARIVACADAYSVMTQGRVYQRAVGRDAAVAELRRSAGTHLDPAVVEALVAVLGPAAAS
jgi:diguanylate cyclase (GGDEF)-like protein